MAIPHDSKAKVTVKLDWKSYFREFNRIHGSSPVVYDDGTLLYQDGWRYSSTDYDGAEYPPPVNKKERIQIQLYYWKRKHGIIKGFLHKLDEMINSLHQIQSERSAPLQQRISYITEVPQEDGSVKSKKVMESTEATEQSIRESRAYLDAEYDLKICKEQIDHLTRQLEECP